MGKASRQPRKTGVTDKAWRAPLAKQIHDSEEHRHGNLSVKSAVSDEQKLNAISDDDLEMEMVPPDITAKIIKNARIQQQDEMGVDEMEAPPAPFKFDDSMFDVEEFEDDNLSDDGEHEDVTVELSPEDDAMLSMYMPSVAPVRRTIADLIMEKIAEKEARASMQCQPTIPDKVVQVYRQVGTLLSRYRSGKLPKAIKVVPSLRNWEEILQLTAPDSWTAAALAAITRLFASNFNSRMAQRFYNLVLLPRIRTDIETHKKLNFHLYMALRKAIFKPAAFFKGILLPLAADNCTAREAIIMSSILAKISIPMMHSGAALLKLADMPYTGPRSVFIKTLLNKKYSFPYQVIAGMVKYFDSFVNDERELPVIWHQSLLIFAQRYKHVVSPEHKERLKRVLRAHEHHQITNEIRRELFFAESGSACQPVLDARAMASALNFNN